MKLGNHVTSPQERKQAKRKPSSILKQMCLKYRKAEGVSLGWIAE